MLKYIKNLESRDKGTKEKERENIIYTMCLNTFKSKKDFSRFIF